MKLLQELKLNNKVYDGIKFNVLIFIPAIGVATFLVSLFLDTQNVKWLLFFFLVVELILGLLLYISTRHYKTVGDGSIIISQTPEGKTLFSLELEIDPDEIRERDSILFAVTHEVDDIRE